MNTLLSISGMRVWYARAGERRDAVRGVSLDVRERELTALVGASGCGKSSLVRGILGLLPPEGRAEGRVLLRGMDISPPRDAGKGYATIGYVPQDPMLALNPVRRVGAQMGDVCRLAHGMSARKAREHCRLLLEKMQLQNVERILAAYPHELSGGMAQRAVLATALLGDPVLLVADEPTSALDAVIRTGLLDDIRTVQRQRGLGVLFVTHDLHLVGRYADTVYVMRDGLIVEHGEAERMLAAPAHPHSRELLRAGGAL